MARIATGSYQLGFLGAGKMAECIARGVVQSGPLSASRLWTWHHHSARRTAFQSFGVNVLEHNSQVVEKIDVVVISVKPKSVKNLLSELRPLLSAKHLLVSVAAGLRLRDLEEWSGHSRFIRVMPNTPATVCAAASVITRGSNTKEGHEQLVTELFGSIGKVWKVDDENLLDAINGLTGSGPAYIYLAIEAWPMEVLLLVSPGTCSRLSYKNCIRSNNNDSKGWKASRSSQR